MNGGLEIKHMVEISKADWKLFRERVSDWQEHYMEQLKKGVNQAPFRKMFLQE